METAQNVSVFAFDSYKSYLHEITQSAAAARGTISRLAEAAGCQRSYLSRVIHGEIHLTEDHAFGLSRFLRMSEDETEYFLLMLNSARAATRDYRDYLEDKRRSCQKRHHDLARKFNRAKAENSDFMLNYYSSWLWSAIHIGSSCRDLQSVKALARRLQVPESMVHEILKVLEERGFVANARGVWSYQPSELHVPHHSPLVSLHHSNWRARAVLDAQQMKESSLHFTAVQTMTDETFRKIREQLLEFIQKEAKQVSPSAPEKLVCIAADFFEV
jgi:uncharacterized protein (TIGR02147 family)